MRATDFLLRDLISSSMSRDVISGSNYDNGQCDRCEMCAKITWRVPWFSGVSNVAILPDASDETAGCRCVEGNSIEAQDALSYRDVIPDNTGNFKSEIFVSFPYEDLGTLDYFRNLEIIRSMGIGLIYLYLCINRSY